MTRRRGNDGVRCHPRLYPVCRRPGAGGGLCQCAGGEEIGMEEIKDFQGELERLINRYSKENGSDTVDHVAQL